MDTQPQPIDMPAPIVDGERRTDPAKEAWNVNPTIEYLETVGVKS